MQIQYNTVIRAGKAEGPHSCGPVQTPLLRHDLDPEISYDSVQLFATELSQVTG